MKKVLTILIIAVLLIGCKNDKKSSSDETVEISLRQEWFPSACYSGDILASKLALKDDKLKINVQQGSEELDPIKMVLSGEDQVGVSSLDRIIQANSKGADLVAIGVVNYKSPTCFITLKKNTFSTIEDFKKYKVGVFTGNNTEMIYKLLLDKVGISRDEINEVEAGWDLNSFINSIYEVRPSFVYDELVSLDSQEIEYNVMYPSDFDVNFIGPVYFVKKAELANNREAYKKFISYTKKGWDLALSNPENAIAELKKYSNDIDTSRELKSLIKGAEYFKGEEGKILYVSQKTILEMGDNLVKLGLLKNKEEILKSIDLTLLNNE
jgi:ABC-type nitrate/sulfonate/bicarbonate transport system substrate-binding protein